MPKVKVMVKNNQTEVRVPVGIRMLIRRCCQAVLVAEHFGQDAEVSVSFVSNAEIRRLNRIYRQKDRATDVLSFPLGQDGHYDTNQETGCALLGDVVISLEMAVKQANMYGHSLEREIGFLTVHSMLHLLGYDHIEDDEAEVMEAREDAILRDLALERQIAQDGVLAGLHDLGLVVLNVVISQQVQHGVYCQEADFPFQRVSVHVCLLDCHFQ